MRKIIILVVLMCTIGAYAGVVRPPVAKGANDWYMFHHDVRHTGRSPFIGPSKPTVKWVFNTGGVICSSPVIDTNGTIYVGSDDQKLYAVNPNGTKKWAFNTGASITATAGIGSDGTVYIGTMSDFEAINGNGKRKWVFKTGYSIESAPAIGRDGTIYLTSASANGSLHAIMPNGTQKWVSTMEGGEAFFSSSPAIGEDGTIYVGCNSGNIYAITSHGRRKWVSRWMTDGEQLFSCDWIGWDHIYRL